MVSLILMLFLERRRGSSFLSGPNKEEELSKGGKETEAIESNENLSFPSNNALPALKVDHFRSN